MEKSAEVIDGKGVADLHGVRRVRKWMNRRRIVVEGWKRGPAGHTAIEGLWRNRQWSFMVVGWAEKCPPQRPNIVYQKVKISQGNSKCFGCKRLETRNWTLEAAFGEHAEVVSFQQDSRRKKSKPARLKE
jgi:hypothetical protein